MGFLSGLGTLLGAGLSFIPGVGVPLALASGAGGLLGGILDQVSSSSGVNPDAYNRQIEMFSNPNSQYYHTAISNQRRTLFDMYMAGVRNQQRLLASKGINSSATSNSLISQANVNATENANQFGTNLYKSGMRELASLDRLKFGAEQYNAEAGNSFTNSFMGIGASLLGNYLGSQSTYTPDMSTLPSNILNSYLSAVPY